MEKKGKIDYKQVFSFFAALSGAGEKTKKALDFLKDMSIIDNKDMGEILNKASDGLENVVKEIKDDMTKRWIYRQAVMAAYMDMKRTKREREALGKIREILKIPTKKAEVIEKWVKDFRKLVEKGEKIILD